VVYQFRQDQDDDPEGTEEKLREYDGAKRVGRKPLTVTRVASLGS
jgi:hypothetical protein